MEMAYPIPLTDAAQDRLPKPSTSVPHRHLSAGDGRTGGWRGRILSYARKFFITVVVLWTARVLVQVIAVSSGVVTLCESKAISGPGWGAPTARYVCQLIFPPQATVPIAPLQNPTSETTERGASQSLEEHPPPTIGGRTLADWKAVRLNSDDAKNLPLLVKSNQFSDDVNTATQRIAEKLKSSGFHVVADESDAVIFVEIKNSNENNIFNDSKIHSASWSPFEWHTVINIDVFYSGGGTIIAAPVTGTQPGPRNDDPAKAASMDEAVLNVCKAIFPRCT